MYKLHQSYVTIKVWKTRTTNLKHTNTHTQMWALHILKVCIVWASHALRVTVSVCGCRLVGQYIDCLFSQIASLIGLERDLDSLGTWTVVWPFVRPTLIIRTLHSRKYPGIIFIDINGNVFESHLCCIRWKKERVRV